MSSPNGATRIELARLVLKAGADLLESLGLQAIPDGSFDPTAAVWSDPVSFIGFGGRQMAGTLIISAPWPLMAWTSPIDDHGPEALADWSRELSNMTLGVLKICLLRRGVELQIGLPTSVVSTDLRVATSSRHPVGQRFACREHAFLVALDCVVAPGLDLSASVDGGCDAAAGGFLLL